MLEIIVYGSPAPQGSKDFKGMSKAGHAILVESSKQVKPWRQDVVAQAKEAMIKSGQPFPIIGPVAVQMFFTLRRPVSAPKKRKYPHSAPDLSKLVRSTEDALTTAGVWEDDARVVRMVCAKAYPAEEARSMAELDTLSSTGAIIRIFPC